MLQFEVKPALKKMETKKAIVLDGIPIETWKCLGDVGVSWLVDVGVVLAGKTV